MRQKIIIALKGKLAKPIGKKSLAELLANCFLEVFKELRIPNGFKLPSNATLAKELGISHITVRKSLLSLQEKDIVNQIHGKGTFINHNFSNNETLSGTVVILLPHIENEYSYLLDSIGKVLSKTGLKVRLENFSWYHSTTNNNKLLEMLDIDNIVGVIRSPSIYPPALIKEIELFKKIGKNTAPVVLIDRPLDVEYISSVGFDDILGIKEIFEYYWNQGERNIYFVYPDMLQNLRNAERGEGFISAAQNHNYNYEEKMITTKLLDNSYIEQMLKYILTKQNEKTTFICSNEAITKKLSNIINKLNIDKNMINFAGFDRSEVSEASKFISSFRSRDDLGRIAGEILIEQIKKRNIESIATKNVLLKPKLILNKQ